MKYSKPRRQLWLIGLTLLVVIATTSLVIRSLEVKFGSHHPGMPVATTAELRVNAGTDKKMALFEWRNVSSLDLTALPDKLASARQMGFNTIYISLNNYIDLDEIPSQAERSQKIDKFTDNLHSYIKTATDAGIKVEAVTGNTSWAQPNNVYLNDKIMDFVNGFNLASPPEQRLRSILFDIEAYNLPDYKQDAAGTMVNFLTAAQHIYAYKAGDPAKGGLEIPIGFALPFWLDNDEHSAPYINFNGAQKYPTFHILDLAAANNGYVLVMAYRNQTDGDDGIYAHIKNEMDYAESQTTPAGIVIGQEINDLQPSKITYFQKGAGALMANIKALNGRYAATSYYQGTSVNDFAAFEKYL